MRKLLSLLGTIAISSSALSALGFQYANKAQSSVIKRINNYIDVSSLLARGTILSQNSNPATGGRGFSLDYASRYIDSRRIGDFFPSEASLHGASKDTKSRLLLGSMFDYPSDNAAFIPQLKESNLDLNPNPKAGKTGSSDLLNTFSTATGVLQILLGNDFNTGLAGLIYTFLNSGLIDDVGGSIKDSIPDISLNYLKNSATGEWIFNELADIWSEDDLLAAYPGRDFSSLTFAEVFKIRQDNFWMGISRILFSGEGEKWVSADKKIKEASTSLDKASHAIPPEKGRDFNLAFNGILIEGIIHLVKYLRTLGVYYERIMTEAMSSQLITKRNHVFDNAETNGVWLGKKINEAYAPAANIVLNNATNKQDVSIWSEENVNGTKKYYQLINIQDLVQFFTKLFVVDSEKDPQSLTTQQALAVILAVPTLADGDKDKAPDIDNPLADVILAPLLNAIGEYFGNRLEIEILEQPVHPEGVGGFLSQLLGFLRAILANGTPAWETSPLTNDSEVLFAVNIFEVKSSGGPYSFYTYLSSILEQVEEVFDTIGSLIPENIKEIVNKVIAAGNAFLSKINQERVEVDAGKVPYEKQNFGNPFRGLMSGELLLEIYNLIDSTGLIDIPAGVRKFIPNLNTALTSKLGEILEAFGIAGEDWPIYLYGLKDKSLSEIVLTVGNRFETDRYKSLAETQKYLFNTRALERLLKPLANNEVKIEFKDNIPEELAKLFDDKKQTNIVAAALIVMAYRSEIKAMTIDTITTQNAFLAFILGIQVDNKGDYSYRPNSFLFGLNQLYGHQNKEEPPALLLASKDSLQKIISELTALVSWMQNDSIPKYVDTFFTPYFLNGWKTKYLSSQGVDNPSEKAFIEYELIYKQTKQQSLTYRIRIERDPWNPDNISQPWFNYGTWKFYSINRVI